MLVPALAVAGPVLVIARSAEVLTVVLNVAVLLAALLSLVVLLTTAVSVSTVLLVTAGLIAATMVIVVLAFFFNDTASTEIYALSLHDALPIYTKVSPAGNVSVTKTFWALDGPLLVTDRV